MNECRSCDHWRVPSPRSEEAASGKCRKVLERVAVSGGIAQPGTLVTEASFGCVLHTAAPSRFIGHAEDVTWTPLAAVIPPGARLSDPPQSQENAERVSAKAIALAILATHAAHSDAHGGLTDDDAARLAGHPGHESYRRRGSDLRANGWIEWKRRDDGTIARRRTQSIGGTAGICVLTNAGRAVSGGGA